MSNDKYVSPLSERYASKEMQVQKKSMYVSVRRHSFIHVILEQISRQKTS